MRRYGVIMAGGGGTRFWPLSRAVKPKQFLNVTGGDIMVNETFDRFSGVVSKEDIFVVTNQAFEKDTLNYMENRIDASHVLGEPAARNTAACIGYAAMEILKKYEDGVMVVVPSDHSILEHEIFVETMQNAIAVAQREEGLVTIGIKPTYPSTGYGYIKCDKSNPNRMEKQNYYPVVEFMEKPELELAKSYIKAGDYTWNSGMFVFKASTIINYFQRLLPDIYECLVQIGDAMGTPEEQDVLEAVYPIIPKISIDYGIMERADKIYMLEGNFTWNDVGSLNELEILQKKDENGNVVFGETALVDCKQSIFYGETRLVAGVGLENMIVVETKDAILVCEKEKAQDVKEIVALLQVEKKDYYL